MANELAVVSQRGVTVEEKFGAVQQQQQGDTAMAAVAAREQAMVQARFIMAERHRRNWSDVRVRLLQHCDRPGFAEVAKYSKPTGNQFTNGEWVKTSAEGFSARFAEVARQEIGNLSSETTVTYEDENCRIVRATVLDLERNVSDSRDIIIQKRVEKRGKQDKKTKEWSPPEGREVLSSRLNSYNEPTYLVRATDDEVRMRQNSEISKAQRDETTRMIPRDILDDCWEKIETTLKDPKKIDPLAARKKLIDSFATLQILPSDLVTYCGCALEKISPAQLNALRSLYTAIKDGEITFQEALRLEYDGKISDESAATEKDRIIEESKAKLAEMDRQKAETGKGAAPPTEEEMDRQMREEMAQEERRERSRPVFGKKDK